MSNFKDKLQVFFLGLLLGLLLGGGFFLFKLDQYVKELSIYKSFTQRREQTAENQGDKKQDPDQGNRKTTTGMAVVHTGQVQTKSPVKDSSVQVVNLNPANKPVTDTVHKGADTLNALVSNREDIVLRKDERVASLSLELINLSPVAANVANSHDSLAAKMAGVKDDRPVGRQFCLVELWTSPLNYKGYKMSRAKIILYGINDPESIRLFKLDDEIYLHSGSLVYHLEYTGDFHAYEKVISESVLAKLK